MSANDLQNLSNELNAAVRWAVEDEVDAQIDAFIAARERAFGDAGSKLTEVKNDKKVIAKRIRDDIKRAKLLPASNADHLPKALKVSVRNPRWNSIDINVTECPVPFENPAHVAVYALEVDSYDSNPDRYTVEGQRIIAVLERIAAQYNYDKSDAMTYYFDVNFYVHVGFSHECPKLETLDAELLADMKVMKMERDPMLGRQLESLNKGRAWTFECGVLNRFKRVA